MTKMTPLIRIWVIEDAIEAYLADPYRLESHDEKLLEVFAAALKRRVAE